MKRFSFLVLLIYFGLISSARGAEKVVIFSQTYCALCEVAKSYLDQHNVPYSEFVIDKSDAALKYFTMLGGRGTPFLIVNSKRMQGFQKDRFWQLYEVASASVGF